MVGDVFWFDRPPPDGWEATSPSDNSIWTWRSPDGDCSLRVVCESAPGVELDRGAITSLAKLTAFTQAAGLARVEHVARCVFFGDVPAVGTRMIWNGDRQELEVTYFGLGPGHLCSVSVRSVGSQSQSVQRAWDFANSMRLGTSGRGLARNHRRWERGDLVGLPDANGGFSVAKVLAWEDGGIHLCQYGERFDALPIGTDAELLALTAGGVGHLPVSWRTFDGWRPSLLQRAGTTDAELVGFNAWNNDPAAGYL